MDKQKIKKILVNRLRKINLFLLPQQENDYRPLILNGRFFTYIALILVLAKLVTLFSLVYVPQSPFFSSIATSVLVKLTNQERNYYGANSLRISPELNQAALMKANDMVANDYFAHWSPQGRSPWYWFQMAGYNYEYAGENLAIGFFDASEVHRAWLNSSTHRANILNPEYQEMGLAVVEKDFHGRKSFLVVQMFGTPRKQESRVVEAVRRELTPTPTPTPTPQEPVLIEEEVVAQETQERTILGDYDVGIYIYSGNLIEQVSFDLLHFLILEYDKIIQKAALIILVFLGFVLLVNVFVRFDVQHPDLIFKGLFFLAVFLVFEYFNQEIIVKVFLESPIINK